MLPVPVSNAKQCGLPYQRTPFLELGLKKYKIQHILKILLQKRPIMIQLSKYKIHGEVSV